MATLAEAAKDFLAQKRLAIVGVSRDSRQPANFNFRKLRDADYEVFPVNPQAALIEGMPGDVLLARYRPQMPALGPERLRPPAQGSVCNLRDPRLTGLCVLRSLRYLL